jgi:hypothetical protein
MGTITLNVREAMDFVRYDILAAPHVILPDTFDVSYNGVPVPARHAELGTVG